MPLRLRGKLSRPRRPEVGSQVLFALALASIARSRRSNSLASSALRKVSTVLDSSPASLGVTSPAAIALVIAAIAPAASPAPSRRGSLKLTRRSRRGGKMRSRHRRNAVLSPESASSIALRVSLSASPSSNASAASVVRWRAPWGLPRGLPERPFEKRPPLFLTCIYRHRSRSDSSLAPTRSAGR